MRTSRSTKTRSCLNYPSGRRTAGQPQARPYVITQAQLPQSEICEDGQDRSSHVRVSWHQVEVLHPAHGSVVFHCMAWRLQALSAFPLDGSVILLQTPYNSVRNMNETNTQAWQVIKAPKLPIKVS